MRGVTGDGLRRSGLEVSLSEKSNIGSSWADIGNIRHRLEWPISGKPGIG